MVIDILQFRRCPCYVRSLVCRALSCVERFVAYHIILIVVAQNVNHLHLEMVRTRYVQHASVLYAQPRARICMFLALPPGGKNPSISSIALDHPTTAGDSKVAPPKKDDCPRALPLFSVSRVLFETSGTRFSIPTSSALPVSRHGGPAANGHPTRQSPPLGVGRNIDSVSSCGA